MLGMVLEDDRLGEGCEGVQTLVECPAGIDVTEMAGLCGDVEDSVHGDGSFDKEAGVYRLYARCRQACPELVCV